MEGGREGGRGERRGRGRGGEGKRGRNKSKGERRKRWERGGGGDRATQTVLPTATWPQEHVIGGHVTVHDPQQTRERVTRVDVFRSSQSLYH